MVVSTRRLHRQNPRSADEDGRDEFTDEFDTRRRRRVSQPPPSSLGQSGAVLDALSDDNSKLARFLRVEGDGDDGSRGNGGVCSWFSWLPCYDATSMSTWEAGFLSLTLEPLKVRNERIIQLFEAYAIFGALFTQGIWIIYEWGSWKSFGGDGSNYVVERVFEGVMAIALGCNILLALWGAMLWIHAIETNSSHEDFAFHSVKPLVYLQYLLIDSAVLVIIGFLLGTYINLSPNWPETAVALTVVGFIIMWGLVILYRHELTCSPLECYHFPAWIKYTNPTYWLRQNREELKDKARLRAHELKKRAYRERKKLDPDFETTGGSESSIGAILRSAAKNLGRADCDVSAYEARLADDWFTAATQLENKSVDFISRYMPYVLAEEVHKLIRVPEAKVNG